MSACLMRAVGIGVLALVVAGALALVVQTACRAAHHLPTTSVGRRLGFSLLWALLAGAVAFVAVYVACRSVAPPPRSVPDPNPRPGFYYDERYDPNRFVETVAEEQRRRRAFEPLAYGAATRAPPPTPYADAPSPTYADVPPSPVQTPPPYTAPPPPYEAPPSPVQPPPYAAPPPSPVQTPPPYAAALLPTYDAPHVAAAATLEPRVRSGRYAAPSRGPAFPYSDDTKPLLGDDAPCGDRWLEQLRGEWVNDNNKGAARWLYKRLEKSGVPPSAGEQAWYVRQMGVYEDRDAVWTSNARRIRQACPAGDAEDYNASEVYQAAFDELIAKEANWKRQQRELLSRKRSRATD